MVKTPRDIWAEWLLNRRFGGDAEVMKTSMQRLYAVRDRVLDHANLNEHQTLLDVGCGDGLIAFGALEKVSTSRVILSDISEDLLAHTQSIAQEMNVFPRCRFIRASADDLSPIQDGSVDIVTTRSVLIYVSAKQQAFREFYRALKPQGRLSIFEPINRFAYPEPDSIFDGYDVTPVVEIARKVKAVFDHLQPVESDPMLNFDERDLLQLAETAGFTEIHLELEVEIKPKSGDENWDRLLNTAGNPKIPTLAEAMQEALTPAETEAFTAHLRPLVEARRGVDRSEVAYLWAVKR